MHYKVLLFLSATLFFKSCTSYRNFDLKPRVIKDGYTYKIAKNSKFTKVKIVSVIDRVLTYRVGKYEQHIHLRDINLMKYKKINAVKTSSLVLVAATALFAIGWSQADTNVLRGSKLNLPPK